MWKKKMTVALSVAFLAGSLVFGSTASAYIIHVGMDDLVAEEKATDHDKTKEQKTTEKSKDMKGEKAVSEKKPEPQKNTKEEKKPQSKAREPEVKLLQDKKAEEKTSNEPKKRMEEKTVEEPKMLNLQMQEKHTNSSKLPVEKKADIPKSEKNTQIKTNKENKKARFQEIFRDSSFIYFMDTKSARYISIPNRQDKMIDVWVKLKPNSFSDSDTDAGKYYLEHYYINPKTQQIQFLCELEVTGRPSNAIKERPYSAQHWENLVPGSVEDDIYHAVVKKVKSSSAPGGSAGPSLTDMFDDYLNIGI